MWARAARVRAYRAHRLAARGLLKDRADRPLSLPQTAGELYCRRRKRKGSRCGAAVGASSAAGALYLINAAPAAAQMPRRVDWGAGENIGTEEVFRVRVRTYATE